jgi:acetoin:2,6-dichlorophenolindophenol oxidoreductase subunit beta
MHNNASTVSVAQAIRDATAEEMRFDSSVILYGLGVNDPGRVFGTTAGLVEEFGEGRVFETPTAENAMMGVAVGAALAGLRPIVTHQRVDFFFLAMDQLVNSAAKWRFMFGAQFSVPLVVRLIVGRGWGQGPTHSQNLATWLSHVPGIKVVYPSNSHNAGTLLREAIRDNNPVVYIEDRWLHSQTTEGARDKELSLGSPVFRRSGDAFTLVAYGSMVSECIVAADRLSGLGVAVDVIDLGTLIPLDPAPVVESVLKTRRLLVVEPGPVRGSFGEALIGSVVSSISGRCDLAFARVLGLPSIPQPTSFGATKGLYPTGWSIATALAKQLSLDLTKLERDGLEASPHDVNRGSFAGPF